MKQNRVKKFPSQNSGTNQSVTPAGSSEGPPETTSAVSHIQADPSTDDAVTPFAKKVLELEIFYDAQTREYLVKNGRGLWISQSEAQLRKRLVQIGFNGTPPKGQQCQLSEIDRALILLQDFKSLTYYGRLAGAKEGYYERNGVRYLVTEGPRLIEPVYGKFPIITSLVVGLLSAGEREHGDTQWNTFMGWTKTAILALRAGKIQQAQALAIAGPRDCGKSLLQLLITELLGGRCAKPASYMMGRSDFNGELFESEHLMLEDEFMSTSIKDRLRLGASIKAMTVSTKVAHCHRKHRQPVNLPVWWRVTISVNDDPEALMVLPPLDDHVADKIIVLRASRFDMPMPTGTLDEKEAFWNTMVGEIPAFLDWIINEFQIPEELRDPRRYGIATWHHPEICSALERLSPEFELLDLIDRAEIAPVEPWSGTAAELENSLTGCSFTRDSARRLLTWSGACGAYLARLAKKRPDRVVAARSSKRRAWRIAPEALPFTDSASRM